MKRRLLALFPAASALLALRAKSTPPCPPARTAAGFAITIQCWSFKEFTLFEAIEMAAASGAGGVELYPGQKIGGPHGAASFSPDLPDEVLHSILAHLEKNHLAAINLGVIDIPNDETAARKIFELARKLGLYGLTTESLDALHILEKLAIEYDLKVAFHNHPKPTALWHPETIWQALEGRHANLGFCADVGHWASSGLDPLAVVQKIAPRVHSFHLKDRTSITEWSHDCPFGTGVLNLPAILDEAREHGFCGNVSIEYETNWQTNLAEISQCVGYLRAYADLRA